MREKYNRQSYSQYIRGLAGSTPWLINALRNDARKKDSIRVSVSQEVIEQLRSFGINLAIGGRGRAIVTGFNPSFEKNVEEYQKRESTKTEADFAEVKSKPIAQWTTDDKLQEVIKRAAALLPGDVGKELLALLDPLALAIMVGIVVVWAVSHFFVAGWIVDAVVLTLGVLSLGPIAWVAGNHLAVFAVKTVNAVNEEDLDEAAKNLSEAIALLGVQVVMALLLKKAPKVLREPSVELDKIVTRLTFKNIKEPPTSSSKFFDGYEGKLTFLKHKFAGTEAPGSTDKWGDIFIHYGKNTPFKEIELTFFHERVHRFLTPRLQLFKSLRQFNTILKRNSYLQSYILRYLEEALAQTVAQVRGNGWHHFFEGIKFPLGTPTTKAYVSVQKIGIEATGIFL